MTRGAKILCKQFFGQIKAFMRIDGISQGKLARMMGVSSAAVSKKLNKHDQAPSLETLWSYAKALGLTVEIVVRRRRDGLS